MIRLYDPAPEPYVDYEPLTVTPAQIAAAIADPSCLTTPAAVLPCGPAARAVRKADRPAGASLLPPWSPVR